MKKFSKVIITLAAGVAIGGALGVLYAPKKGSKTRREVSRKSKRFIKKVNEQMSKEKMMELKGEFEDQLGKINDLLKRATHMG